MLQARKVDSKFKLSLTLAGSALTVCMMAKSALAEDVVKLDHAPSTIMDAISMGKPMTSFRLRYENVNQQGNAPVLSPTRPLEDANALTLRSLIGWNTAVFNNFSFTLQLINVSKLDGDFNDSTPTSGAFTSGSNQPNKLAYAKVVDPDYTGINQLYVDWSGIQNTNVRLGRQQINLDNVRFIGDIGFRQVMQVFDGISISNKFIPDTEVYLSHLEAVQQVNTELRTNGALDIAHVKYKLTPTESLVGYGYFSSFSDLGFGTAWLANATANQSNQIIGLRLDGAHPIDPDLRVLYTAEFAHQGNYQGGDSRIDANYYKVGGGIGVNNFSIRADQELLGSNNGTYAFQTPFGTNHLFQGWVDKFLTTPKEGLRDSFVTAAYKYSNFVFSGEYHLFNSDADFNKVGGDMGNKYGTEVDAAVTYNYSKNISTKIEYGKFSEGDQYLATASRFRDTNKFWLTAMYAL